MIGYVLQQSNVEGEKSLSYDWNRREAKEGRRQHETVD